MGLGYVYPQEAISTIDLKTRSMVHKHWACGLFLLGSILPPTSWLDCSVLASSPTCWSDSSSLGIHHQLHARGPPTCRWVSTTFGFFIVSYIRWLADLPISILSIQILHCQLWRGLADLLVRLLGVWILRKAPPSSALLEDQPMKEFGGDEPRPRDARRSHRVDRRKTQAGSGLWDGR